MSSDNFFTCSTTPVIFTLSTRVFFLLSTPVFFPLSLSTFLFLHLNLSFFHIIFWWSYFLPKLICLNIGVVNHFPVTSNFYYLFLQIAYLKWFSWYFTSKFYQLQNLSAQWIIGINSYSFQNLTFAWTWVLY